MFSSCIKTLLFLIFIIIYKSQLQPMSKRIESDKWVFKFTEPTIMKFQPVEDFQQPQQQSQGGLFSRIRNFFSPPSKTSPKSALKRKNSVAASETSIPAKSKGKQKPNIKFVKRLTNQHVLVGNEDQLDVMSIGGIVGQFVDTEFFWSLKIKKAIIQVAIDYKKSYILLLSEGQVQVYGFDNKNLTIKPTLLGSVSLSKSVKYIHVLRESIFSLCYKDSIEIYLIDEVKGIRLTVLKKYDLPPGNLELFQVPQPYENILNIFFQEEVPNQSNFSLWNIVVEFYEKQVKLTKASKIYEIPKYLRPYARLENYSKSIYLINLGKDIYAVRKGYVIDNANVNILAGNNHLRYLSNNKLIHVTDHKVEVYNFSIDETVHPPRIIVDSTDSIQIPPFSNHYEFVEAVEILSDNFSVFYQLKQSQNKLLKGETKYAFILTHMIKMEDKLKNILPQEVDRVDIENLEERADMAKKMGLQRKQIYLRLWNSSNKSQVEDYKLLLDTLDYETIKAQIQKKLKKNSMNFRQVQLIEHGCMSMLQKSVFGPQNTKEDIKNYLISNTLIRKLDLYKAFTLEDKKEGRAITQDPTGKLLINIQNYNYYKTVDIKSMLFELINRFCNDDKNEIDKIRILIKKFKFPLRVVYRDILTEIIANTKKKFLKLIKAIPEILPYDPPTDSTLQDVNLLSGIWTAISQQDWQRHLYIDTVCTLDNRQNLNEVCSNVWYKRYWLTQHDYINKTKAEIIKLHKELSSYQTFYLVLEKLFQYIKEYEPIREIIDYIQDTYEAMPQHIYGKIFLYRKLFDHFKENRNINRLQEVQSFALFLKLKDDDLFKAMFNFEKVKKGFILKEMKPLYQKLSCVEVFNQGLLNYFASNKSEISDIKYILNRLNNQKREFHEENKGIYEVLVRGMQLKLKLGSDQDIPIDEVLIYIENIPINDEPMIEADLKLMKRINEETQRFKDIKLNMTIFQMTRNMDNVVAALIHEEIRKADLLNLKQIEQIRNKTYQVIEDVETIKQKIYPQQGNHQLSIFIFITQILQSQDLIPAVAILLEDQEINKRFSITQILIENIVIYSYRCKMTNSPAYKESAPYIRELVSLLPADNRLRQYIEAELELAEMLTCADLTVYYPLSGSNQYFTSRQLQNLICQISGPHLLSMSIQSIYECALKVQQLSSDNELSEITLHGVYEMFIYRLIDCHMLKEVVPKINTLIQLQGDSPYNFIYPSLLVSKIAPEMIEQNRNLLLKCSTHLFRNSVKLVSLLQQIMSIQATSSQYKALILSYYSAVRYQSLNYSQQCPLLEPSVLALLNTDEVQHNFILLLRYSLYNLLSQKEQFAQLQYYIMFIILVNDPYVLAKYLYSNIYKISLKTLRCFLSFLIKEDIFSKSNVLQFGKRLFYIIYQTVSKNKNIELVIDEVKKKPLSEPLAADKIQNPRNQLEKQLLISLDRLKSKIKTHNNQIKKRKAKGLYKEDAKIEKVKRRLLNPRSKEGTFDYPFLDSDDGTRTEDLLKREDKLKAQKIEPFDSKFERQSLLKRNIQDLALYISVEKRKHLRKYYYSQKLTKDGIYGSLTIEKSIQRQIHEAFEKTFGIGEETPSPRRRLRIGKVQSQNFSKAKEDMRRSRSRAINEITTEERLVIEKQEQEIMKTPTVSIVGNVAEQAAILMKILTPDMQITEETKFNFEQLESYRVSHRFSLLLRELIQMAYHKEDIPFKGVLIFIKRLNQAFVETKITKEWIEIYLRAEALQNKFKLDLPIRDIFTVQGLFLQSQIPDNLFHRLLSSIIKHVNDENILKICKVVNLAFKKTELQQQIFYYYLFQLLTTYRQSLEADEISGQDLKMQKEKFKMIINKIPTKYLFEKEDNLIKIFRDQTARREIVNMFIDSFRNRYDLKAADAMYDKYIVKVKKNKKQ